MLAGCDSNAAAPINPPTSVNPAATADQRITPLTIATLPTGYASGVLLTGRRGTVALQPQTSLLPESPSAADVIGGKISLRVVQPALQSAAAYQLYQIDESPMITVPLTAAPLPELPTQGLVLTPSQQLEQRNLGPGRYVLRVPDWQGGDTTSWYYFNIMGE